MSVKIRFTRIGRHKDPFYRIVASDSHSPRDGRIIEQIGYFDPAKPEADAVINEELALKWLKLGATPSDSVRSLFTVKGIMAKHAATKAKKAKSKTVKTHDFSKKPTATKETKKAETKKAPKVSKKDIEGDN